MTSSFILAAARSAVTPRNGPLAALQPHELGSKVARACLDRAGMAADQVDEIILGNVLALEGNLARIISLGMGLSPRVGGLTIDRQCASGLDAIVLADSLIRSGQADVVLAGGVESYSHRPACFPASVPIIPAHLCRQPPFTPWADADPDMFAAAEALAQAYGIAREDQDAWACESHRKAQVAATGMGGEIVTDLQTLPSADSHTGRVSARMAARVRPIVGSITAANTAIEADGAAFCLIASEAMAHRVGVRPVRIIHGCTVGADHELPGQAPIVAIREALAQADLAPGDLGCAEIMEAFAVQAVVNVRESGLDPSIVNVGGGALARGHPAGASGAILAVRLVHELLGTPGTGLAAIAAAGGLATSLILECADV